VAVIYPQVREPYRAVFRSISEGIAAASARSAVHELAPGEDLPAVERKLAAQPLDAVILLGKRGLDLSAQLGSSTRRIVGAVFAQPDEIAPGVSVISLAPAPRMLFTKLRELAPAVKRIHVIYGADENDWLIELARGDAAKLGYELVPLRKESIREGASAYRELLKQVRSPQDAIWLLQASPFLDENSVLQWCCARPGTATWWCSPATRRTCPRARCSHCSRQQRTWAGTSRNSCSGPRRPRQGCCRSSSWTPR
jgi:putative ABC transport system substrate-binding protein